MSHTSAPSADDERACRICLVAEPVDDLVQPCACRGTSAWVHGGCLERWRRTCTKPEAAYQCGQCGDDYRDELSLELLRDRLQQEREEEEERVPAVTMTVLAQQLQYQGKYDAAEPLFREVLASSRQTLGDRHPNTLTSICNMALLLRGQGKLTEAEPLNREALTACRETLGDRHPQTLISMNNLASLLQGQGKFDEAEPLCREDLAASRETLGDRHRNTLCSISNMALLLQDQGKLDEAEPLWREALTMRRETLGDRHLHTLHSIGNMAVLLKDQGKYAEAEPLVKEALTASRETLGDRHPSTLVSISNMASLLHHQGKLDEAEPLMREALTGLRETLGSEHPHTRHVLKWMRLLEKEMAVLLHDKAMATNATLDASTTSLAPADARMDGTFTDKKECKHLNIVVGTQVEKKHSLTSIAKYSAATGKRSRLH